MSEEWSVACPYCGKPAKLVTGDIIYPNRADLSAKYFWQCEDCDAYVGTHDNSPVHKPLGRLANASLRKAKIAAHAQFDPIWRVPVKYGVPKSVARKNAYAWLSQQLNIPMKRCHIGYFDIETCRRVAEVCQRRNEEVNL